MPRWAAPARMRSSPLGDARSDVFVCAFIERVSCSVCVPRSRSNHPETVHRNDAGEQIRIRLSDLVIDVLDVNAPELAGHRGDEAFEACGQVGKAKRGLM